VHGIPNENRVINDGDLVSVDCGAIINGWHGDAAITIGVGNVKPEHQKLSDITEVYIRNILKFSKVYLWCEEEMIDFYFNLGYSIESKEKDKYVLVKNLI
jgi:hypothetical protein